MAKFNLLILLLTTFLLSCGLTGKYSLDLSEYSKGNNEISTQNKLNSYEGFSNKINILNTKTEDFSLKPLEQPKDEFNFVEKNRISKNTFNTALKGGSKKELSAINKREYNSSEDPVQTTRLFLWSVGLITFALLCLFLAFKGSELTGLLIVTSFLAGVAALISTGKSTQLITETDKADRTNFQKIQLIFNILHLIIGGLIALASLIVFLSAFILMISS
ncbi:MAG: hypothetical protein MK078_14910 [Crocinitomicaceae bacterium]|nr:hypothetical protein [Crocinitomicaceae bacterium]